MTINLDMDGTFVNLYGVNGWLNMLTAKDETPYVIAKPLVRLNVLARHLNRLQSEGYEIAVISWLSKNSTPEYDMRVANAKLAWLEHHMPSVKWDRISIVAYGTPKEIYCENPYDILFDDEKPNRDNWTGQAYGVENILEILKNL